MLFGLFRMCNAPKSVCIKIRIPPRMIIAMPGDLVVIHVPANSRHRPNIVITMS